MKTTTKEIYWESLAKYTQISGLWWLGGVQKVFE